MESGKGWHRETMRHSEAKLNGKASPSKFKTGITYSNGVQYWKPTDKGKTIRVGSSPLLRAYPKIMKQFDYKEKDDKEREKQFEEELKESKAQIEKDYNSVSKKEYQTHKEETKDEKYVREYLDVNPITEAGRMKNLNNKSIDELKQFNNEKYEEQQEKILEELEDRNHVDLSNFYGEDYEDPETIRKLRNKIKYKRKTPTLQEKIKYNFDA